MDSEQKRRLRRISIPLFWVAEVYLLVSLILSLFVRLSSEGLEEDLLEASAINGLIMADNVFFDGFASTFMDKEQGLIAFPPPHAINELASWADSIRQYLDVECSVFLFDGKEMFWAFRSPRFEAFEAKLDSAIRLPEKKGPHVWFSSFGSYNIRKIFFTPEKFRAVTTRRNGSPITWGVFYDFKDNFLSYVRRLQAASDSINRFELSTVLKTFDIYVSPDRKDSKAPSPKYGLQLFLPNDSLIFTTASVDTSYRKFEQRHEDFPIYWRVFNNGQDEATMRWQAELVADRFEVPWPKILLTAFLMVVLALFYHWIYKLSVS